MPKRKKKSKSEEERKLKPSKFNEQDELASKETEGVLGEEETFHIDLDLSEGGISEPAEQSLEELTETPEVLTETTEFSEFMISETSEMPTLTLPSSPASQSSFTEPAENLENSASAADSIATSADSAISGQVYSARDYSDYFGKSYAETNYRLREDEIRNLIRQNTEEKPIIPLTPLVQRGQDERIQQVNAEDWSRQETELKGYNIENIAKKEVKKRKLID